MKNKRKMLQIIAAGVLTLSIVTACLPEMQSLAAGRPAHVKAATYFSDDWAANFWNSESVHMDEELSQIAADGFNCIILVVPWREFQPYMNPAGYSNYALNKLDRVMQCASEHGLGVMLRVGYTWDYAASSSVLDRYQQLLTSESVRDAWKQYVYKIYQTAVEHGNLYGGFLTWEDFWNYIDTAGSMGHGTKSIAAAKSIGYQDYLLGKYSLDQINDAYHTSFGSYQEIYIPDKTEAAFRLFYEFYDHFLNELLLETQAVFPDLSMEVRLDEDAGIGHTSTFGCGNASYVSAMYNVAMGEGPNVSIGAASAIVASSVAFSKVHSLSGGKALFLDQFLYMDNTSGFENSAQIAAGQLPSYLTGMAPVFRSQTMGYGIWTYRNYCDNVVYNAQFALGENGWKFTGGASVAEEAGNRRVKFLADGGKASQVIGNRNSGHMGKEIRVRFLAKSDEKQTIVVSLGGQSRSVSVNGEKHFDLNFGKVNPSEVSINGRSCWVDDVCVYSHVQEGQLYGIDNQPQSCLEAMRTLNHAIE